MGYNVVVYVSINVRKIQKQLINNGIKLDSEADENLDNTEMYCRVFLFP